MCDIGLLINFAYILTNFHVVIPKIYPSHSEIIMVKKLNSVKKKIKS